jgi:gliding motility-associated-like protein
MKHRLFFSRWQFLLLGFFLLISGSGNSQTQLPECTADVPFFVMDLSASPTLTYTTPEFVRKPGCCGNTTPTDDHVSFYVTLHPDVAMFELIVAPGYADPGGAGTYNIISGDLSTPGDCGVSIPGGAPVCITGAGPHKITYRKPGGNKIKYIFRQIPKPIYPLDQPTRLGCTLPLPIYGLNNISINATAKSPNLTASLATANTYLSCLNCADPIFSPGANATYPYTITYEVTGTPQAAACGVFPTSGSFTVTVYDALNVSVTPNPGTFCAGGPGVNLTATATGGDANYTYTWFDENLLQVGTGTTYLAPAQGNYTVQVSDGLITATCPSESETVSVSTANTPEVNAGPDLTACQSSPTVVLNGSVLYANPFWVGGNGTFSPNRSTAIATYTPTPAEITSGSVTLTLTSVNAGGGCINTSDEVTILYSTLMTISETIGDIVCNGQTTTISAAVSGGIPAYDYQWTNGETTSSITVSAGTYGLTVTDQFSCSVTEYYTVNQPTPIQLETSSIDETVATGDGSVSLTISGGDSPYSIVWTDELNNTIATESLSTPPYISTVSPLGYGFYTATVTDANGCAVASSVVVNTFACSGLSTLVSATDVDCYGASTGTVTALASGGDPAENYGYSWNTTPVQNTATANNLPAGVYTVTVTDNETGCIDVASVAIFQPTILTNTITSSDVTIQGGNDGSATANPLGGTPVYTYAWSTVPEQTTQTASNLIAGTYAVTITDAEGCFINDAVFINEPPCNDFLLAVNTTNVLCNGGNTGAASLFITNGTPPFSILWSTGAVDVTSITNLIAGNYSVDVTDDNGCFTTKNFTITQPDPISIGLAPTNITCFGSNNGTIDLTVTGGTYPQYSYSWSSSGKIIANHQDLTLLGPGTYSVAVTDENGCTATASVGITQPAKLDGAYTYTDNLCFGQTNGSIDATITGGTLNYTYAWSGPNGYSNTTQDISGLAAGLYELNVTDGNNCDFGPMQVYINQPTLLQSSAAMTQEVSCAGGADGAADLTVTGGVMPYAYAWTGPGTFSFNGEDLVNVGAGTYNVTITDFNGCTSSTSVILTTTADIIDPIISCVGNQNVNTSATACTYTVSGTAWNATATDECFLASLTYELSGVTLGTGTTLTGVAFNLGTTTVTWTATDGSGNTATCAYDVSVTDITNPTLENCLANQTVNSNTGVCTYTVSGTAWDATATDNCTTVTLTASVTGATTASGLTTLNGFVFNLGASTVTWTATDGSSNTVTCSYEITVTDDQDPILANCIADQTVTSNPGVCTYTVSGTAWDATATDNCTTVTLTANVTGATTASGLTTLHGFVFNLGTSTVTWTATDGSSNSATCSYNITVTDNQLPSFTSCVGSTQNVDVDVNECDYTVSGTAWDAVATDNCTISSVIATLTGATSASGLTTLNNVNFNVGTTTVTWTVTDGSNNTQTCTFNVVVTDNILPSFTTCGAPGNQTVNANAGICTYTHPNNSWNASATDNCTVLSVTAVLTGATTASGLSTLNGTTFNLGTTTVTWTVVDIHGNNSTCSFNVLVVDNQNPIITSCGAVGNQTVVADAGECNFTQTGTGWNASATDNCSVPTIVYTLSGATNGTGTSLTGVDFNLGTTTVLWTVTDGSGNTSTCTFNVTVQDTQLPAITSCGAVGTQTMPADAGVCTYTVSGTAWNATASDNCTVTSLAYTLTGATSGTGTSLDGVVFNPGTTLVTWTVLDQSGNSASCSFSVVVIDEQAPVISGCPTTINTNTDLNVCGATVEWTVPSYTDNCGAAMTFTHTPGSLFSVGTTTVVYTVTDGAGNVSTCSFNVNVTDNQLPAITCAQPIETCDPLVTFTAPVASDNCGIQTVTQTAGLASNSLFPVGITTNTYLVTDIHGNTNSCSFTVEVFPVPVIALEPTDVSCFGFDNGSIDATVTIGTAPYTYNWSNNATTEDLNGLAPGTYTLDVTDDNGCAATATAVITQPAVLQLSATDDHVNCFNGTDGSIDITVTGGTLPYTYAWSNGSDNQNISGLTEGSYDVLVTDALGCEISYSTVINQPDTLLIQYQVYSATCTAENGGIQAQVTGGTTPYTYEWSNETTGLNLNNVASGFYTFIVTDAQGCTNSITTEITSLSNIGAEVTVKDLRCYNDNTGEITAFVTSGNAPFTYDWSNGETTPVIEGLAAGDYSVTITDAFGCQMTETVTVDQPDSLIVSLTSPVFTGGYNVSFWNGNNGSILAEVEGGTAPYNYIWSNGETSAVITDLKAGTYSIIVTDMMGCTAYASTRLTQPDILEMPNGFSPNGDGANDFFVVHGIDAYPINRLTIYNRWGNIVYELENYQNEWNGENNLGEPLPDATYFVILAVEAGNDQIVLKGYVDLRR